MSKRLNETFFEKSVLETLNVTRRSTEFGYPKIMRDYHDVTDRVIPGVACLTRIGRLIEHFGRATLNMTSPVDLLLRTGFSRTLSTMALPTVFKGTTYENDISK